MSVAPRSLPLVKRVVRSISVRDAEIAATAALHAATAADAERELLRRLREAIGDLALH